MYIVSAPRTFIRRNPTKAHLNSPKHKADSRKENHSEIDHTPRKLCNKMKPLDRYYCVPTLCVFQTIRNVLFSFYICYVS